ncbi:DUF192 domain-containing protein [Novosphingobium sp. PhB55]|uniref:DUF192 domain-containing protein n=1 Tax=unclassified Novosphingobium TaxID=2644732 RepID=UPI0010CEC2DF|nr:DUF192 domain-containing protein [Novosphingobium sp. PhB55]TDW63211.1 hypothetical protein EDF57_106171 [Novosphingobium sp. PhB55]
MRPIRQLPALFACMLVSGVVLSATGCSRSAGEAAGAVQTKTAIHPVSGLPVIPLVVRVSGKAHGFEVEVARSEAEQAKGLMFRTEMGVDEGMIFPRKAPAPAAFWMRNTVIPLDLLFIGPDHRILNIAANARPYDETPLPSAGPVIAVLELNGGRAAQLGIAPGDEVSWKAP